MFNISRAFNKVSIGMAMLASISYSQIANSSMPVGIPDPAGSVPAAIMPTLPSSANQISGYPYDPINTATPTWNNESNQYYIDSSAGNCDDSANSGRGSQSTPRCNLPNITGTRWTLGEGTQLFIAGDGAQYGNDMDINYATMTGSADNPVWIIGVGDEKPRLRFSRFSWLQGTHVFFESVHFSNPGDNFRMYWNAATGPVEYFTFRNVECSGSDGTHSGRSRRCFSIGGTSSNINRFLTFYNVDVHGLGRWQDDRNTGVDMHGFQMQKWSRYVWLLNSRVYHVQGDSIQCGNSQWFDYDYASRPHYIYIGNNEFYENYENAYDQKGCYHMVFSQNHVHDFYNSVKGANGTAIITEQDSEGDIGGRFSWFINNTIERTDNALAAKATTSDGYVYILGNVIRDIGSSALDFTQRCYSGGSSGTTCPLGMTFAHNTIDCNNSATVVRNVQNPTGSNQNIEIDGNIFYNCTNGGEGTTHNWESFAEQPLNLIHTQNVHYRSSGSISLISRRYDVLSNNTFNENVNFANTTDYALEDLSPAAGFVTSVNDAYSTFETLYGLSIRKDLYGNDWSGSSRAHAGANQAAASAPALVPPNPPFDIQGTRVD